MTVNELIKVCRKTFALVGLDFDYYGIEVAINGRLTKTLGRCMYMRRFDEVTPYKIEFSREFLDTATEKCIEDIVKHECSHAIATIETGEKHGHDSYFKSVCKRVGTTNDGISTDVDRTVEETKVYKYFVVCEKCGGVCGKYHKAGKVVQHPEYYYCKCGGSLKVIKNF